MWLNYRVIYLLRLLTAKSRIRHNIRRPLPTFLHILSLCSFQFKFLSMITPSDFLLLTRLSLTLPIKRFDSLLNLSTLFVYPITIYSLFTTLRLSRFAISQSLNCRSKFTLIPFTSISDSPDETLVSSAYILGIASERQPDRSFMNGKKSRGPNMALHNWQFLLQIIARLQSSVVFVWWDTIETISAHLHIYHTFVIFAINYHGQLY